MEHKWVGFSKQTDRAPKTVVSDVKLDPQYNIAPADLVLGKLIGVGFYGPVLLGEWRGAKVAIKKCNNDVEPNCFLSQAKAMLDAIPHPNIVQVMGVSIERYNASIVLEYCSKGSLKGKVLSQEQQREYAFKIASAMASLHNFDIVHGNLSAQNILLDSYDEPKVSDYGRENVVEQVFNSKKPVHEVMRWMAPESFDNRKFTKQSDVWSYGILLYELASGREPHIDADQLTVGMKIRDEGLTPVIPNDCDPAVKKVMEMCWRVNPSERPTMEQIVNMFESDK